MPRVSITFEFNSNEEAVLFLGKQIPEDGKGVMVQTGDSQVATPQPGEKRGRGRPRTKGKAAAGGGGSSPAEAPAAAAAETAAPETAGAEKQETAPAAAVPTKEQLVTAMQEIMDTKGIDAVMTVLAKYGVEGAGQLPEAKRAEFVTYCGKVARGEVKAGE